MIKRINLDSFNNFIQLSSRYFELHSEDTNKVLIYSAKVNISYAIQDINHIIDRINDDNDLKDSSWYYELISKAYQILSAFDEIEKAFCVMKSGYDQLYGPQNEEDAINRKEERQIIDYFRALRSLTTAHTLKNTDKSFEKFGIAKDTHLEDVRLKKSYRFREPEVNGDIILEIRINDNNSDNRFGRIDYQGIWIEKDIITPIRIILSKLEIVNKRVEDLIITKESILKNEEIKNIHYIDSKFLIDLKAAVKKRYPREIEIVKYDDREEIEYWEIQEMYDFVSWQYTFGDERDEKLERLKEIKRKELLHYAEKVQKMELKNEDYYSLSSGINNDGIAPYYDEKISGYLDRNKRYPNLKEIERWRNDMSNASQLGQVSNEIYACLLLREMQQEIDMFFRIEWNTSFRELYWQYLVALFVRQQID